LLGLIFLLSSCKKNDSHIYSFNLTNKTETDLFVTWNINGKAHLDTLHSSLNPGLQSVSQELNSNRKIEFDLLNNLYNCKVVSADSSRIWEVSDLTEYSKDESSEPFFNLFFENYLKVLE
jgi:hypothetical protein